MHRYRHPHAQTPHIDIRQLLFNPWFNLSSQVTALNTLSAFRLRSTRSQASSRSPTRPFIRSARKTCCRLNTRTNTPTSFCATRHSTHFRATTSPSNRKCHLTTCAWVGSAEVRGQSGWYLCGWMSGECVSGGSGGVCVKEGSFTIFDYNYGHSGATGSVSVSHSWVRSWALHVLPLSLWVSSGFSSNLPKTCMLFQIAPKC